MIYLVTKKQELFDDPDYTIINVEKALEIINMWKIIQVDSETSGRNPHICKLLCFQFGNDAADTRIVLDCESYPITLFKDILESKLLIGHNLKFDLQFLYNYGIVPRKVYDTMIVEQFLYMGYPTAGKIGGISYALNSVAARRLDVNIDKSVRGEIIWRGLDKSVILYAAGDVTYLEKIMWSQVKDYRAINGTLGAKLECSVVPAMAYMEWCGIKLDEEKWLAKMKQDKINLDNATKALNDYVMQKECCKQWVKVDTQGDLFEGFNTEPYWTVNWQKKEAIKVVQALGFDTKTISKTTGEEADSVLEKNLKTQKGIDDTFLDLYFKYQEYYKVTTSFGRGHLNSINPITGRLHTTFKQLGAASGRMSCGSSQSDTDLEKYKHLPKGSCKSPNLQQLPSDAVTRGAFVAPEGNLMVSADFSAEESRLAADIYQDKEFYEEFAHRSGDTHSMFAWVVFRKECEACGCKGVADVKKLAPQWRKAVKGVEFAYLFGAAAPTISQTAGCTVEEAQSYINSMDKEFSGVSSFAKKGSQFVRNNGYIIINPITGHRLHWWDWNEWKMRGEEFNREGFWEEYKIYHKGTGDGVAQRVKQHQQVAGKYDRLARNVVTQGTGAIIMKCALTKLFDWIVENGYFGKIHICCAVHDEIVCDYPKEVEDFPKVLEKIMEESAAIYCKSLPIPAEGEVSDHWVH